jgi:polysaccharide export outer membrane protein
MLRSLAAAAALMLVAAPVCAQPQSSAARAPAAPAKPAAVTPQTAPAPTPVVVVDANFTLGVGDSVNVGLVGRNDFNTAAQVSSEGTIFLPLVGQMKALGLTTAELAKQIQASLKSGGFFSDPLVHIEVTGVASRYATILGDVGSPGLLPLDRDYHLSDVLARVGARAGEGRGTIVVTHSGGQSKRYSIEEIATGGPDGDPKVQPGDKLYFPASEAEVFYISGQVRSPGAFPATQGLTVREAIARGGGLTDMGSERKTKVYRKNVQLKNVTLDTVLQPGDIVQIGERLF